MTRDIPPGVLVLVIFAGLGGLWYVHVGRPMQLAAELAGPAKTEAEESPPPPPEPPAEVARHLAAFHALAGRARTVEGTCRSRGTDSEYRVVGGRVLVWDVADDDVSDAHARLPAAMRADNPDGELTV